MLTLSFTSNTDPKLGYKIIEEKITAKLVMHLVKQNIYDKTHGKYFKLAIQTKRKQSKRHKTKEKQTVNNSENRKIKEHLQSPYLDSLTQKLREKSCLQ